MARFLDIPGGQEIVQESYAQLRKFNCWNISIVQQYARFKQSWIRSAVFGNSRQFFIRQNDRGDLDDMGRDIALPEVTQHAIMNYPLPDHQSGQVFPSPTCTPIRPGDVRNGPQHRIPGNALLLQFKRENTDKRARELRQSPSVVEGIIAHARPNPTSDLLNHETRLQNKLFVPRSDLIVALTSGCAATRPMGMPSWEPGCVPRQPVVGRQPHCHDCRSGGRSALSEGLHHLAGKEAQKA